MTLDMEMQHWFGKCFLLIYYYRKRKLEIVHIYMEQEPTYIFSFASELYYLFCPLPFYRTKMNGPFGYPNTSLFHSHSLFLVTKSCLTLATPWTVACQASWSMGFSKQEYWSGLPFLSLGLFSYTILIKMNN